MWTIFTGAFGRSLALRGMRAIFFTSSTLATGTATRFIGFVTPFGAAPPDFNAQTLVDFSNTASDLLINWRGDGAAAFAIFVTIQLRFPEDRPGN